MRQIAYGFTRDGFGDGFRDEILRVLASSSEFSRVPRSSPRLGYTLMCYSSARHPRSIRAPSALHPRIIIIIIIIIRTHSDGQKNALNGDSGANKHVFGEIGARWGHPGGQNTMVLQESRILLSQNDTRRENGASDPLR